jgi:NifU-like protein involved in Fe-S cluster formation
MSTDADLMSLYSTRILALAALIPHVGRLDHPQASVRKRAPLCGSTVTVDLSLDGDVITEFAQDVKACALGQAAASVLGGVVLGRTLTEVRTARDALRAMLKSDGPVPDAPFDRFEVLLPARGFANRHASILLAIEATVEAGEEAQRSACA